MPGAQLDILVIGGGAIGLSIGWCAARRGARVAVLERDTPGQQSSWAAAGILPFGRVERAATAYARAMAESGALHAEHAERLRAETGIDVGYEVCGELLTALDPGELPALAAEVSRQRAAGATVEPVDPRAYDLSPRLLETHRVHETAQIRPPRYLRALEAACLARGVALHAHSPVEALLRDGSGDGARVIGARTAAGAEHHARATVIAAGAWAPALSPVALDVRPLRGQIVLLRAPARPFQPIVSLGHEYLVPRADGRVLVGSTMEDVGFDARTTEEATRHLLDVAVRLAPALATATVERAWAGLRPATPSGEPVVGRAPEAGLWVAAGHTRQGVHLAPHTGETIAQDVLDG